MIWRSTVLYGNKYLVKYNSRGPVVMGTKGEFLPAKRFENLFPSLYRTLIERTKSGVQTRQSGREVD